MRRWDALLLLYCIREPKGLNPVYCLFVYGCFLSILSGLIYIYTHIISSKEMVYKEPAHYNIRGKAANIKMSISMYLISSTEDLTLKAPNKNCSRRHFNFFTSIFRRRA